nr:PREDICTED: centrosome-associated protein 350-like [Latimeria chalumnae]|eukprot:XP_014346190.1 PREDICTED: centrosome-associated protein 350-like [Latimeria chalumnae]
MEEASHLDDVALAWDSLQEAKAVLQQIENKLSFENESGSNAQSVRRRLQLERETLSGHSVKAPGASPKDRLSIVPTAKVNGDKEKELFPVKLNTISTLSRVTHDDILGWKRQDNSSENLSLGDLSLAKANCAYNYDNASESYMFRNSQITNTDDVSQVVKVNVEERSSPKIMHTSSDRNNIDPKPDLCKMKHLQSSLRSSEMDSTFLENKCVLFGIHTAGITNGRNEILKNWSSDHSFLATQLSSASSSHAKNLMDLKDKSPKDKLERLKEKIRKQRQLCVNPVSEQNGCSAVQNLETLNKGPPKRKVRKVTFAPPPPVYKGVYSGISKLYSK